MKNFKNGLIQGAWRFGLLGVLAFAVWMAPFKLGTAALYSSIAAVFIVGSGLFNNENGTQVAGKVPQSILLPRI